MSKGTVAHATAAIEAPVGRVWDALINPRLIKQYFFGTDVTSEWKEGSPIRWKGNGRESNDASEQSREHSEKNWQTMLSGLKALLEK
jgi:hypothetical protein